jgi:hypothetical protein
MDNENIKLKHASGQYKKLPPFPTEDDVLFFLHENNITKFTPDGLSKKMKVPVGTIGSALTWLGRAGSVEKRGEYHYYKNDGEFKYPTKIETLAEEVTITDEQTQ